MSALKVISLQEREGFKDECDYWCDATKQGVAIDFQFHLIRMPDGTINDCLNPEVHFKWPGDYAVIGHGLKRIDAPTDDEPHLNIQTNLSREEYFFALRFDGDVPIITPMD